MVTLSHIYNGAHTRDWDDDITGDTLEDIARQIIDHLNKWHPSADRTETFEYDFYFYPGVFLLDDDEEAPAAPDFTEAGIIALAATAFDAHPQHFTIDQ